jgi:hypothetical protein
MWIGAAPLRSTRSDERRRGGPAVRRESRGISIERGDGSLTVSVRTFRTGDLMHYVFGALATVFALTVLWVGAANGTLLDSFVTVPLILAGAAYGWFALTRRLNRRVLTVDGEMLTVSDGPLFTLAPDIELSVGDVGTIAGRKERRWVPPLSWYDVRHLEAAGASHPLFRNFTFEEDADRIRAALVSFLAKR